MAAVLGASGPTILAIGPVSVPELQKYKYDRKLSLGALTCGGVLGPLIPPSATAIIVAGRSGSAFAAEIGTMKISEEVDALHSATSG